MLNDTITTKKIKLSLVGAGPGDPDLITLKGIKTLAKADAILYDALVNPDLLDYAPKEIPKIFVGKRAGKHSYTQTEINQLIVEYAYHFGHVVRLKGGDPFVFGRGQEEIEYAEAFGISTEVIPGISSSISLPAIHKIPLTKRGINESFWVITGTTKSGEISSDITLAAQSKASVIILMGMKKLKEIQAVYLQHHQEELPFVIIQNGSMPNEKTGFGTLKNLLKVASKNKLDSPAVIMIGEVVRTHPAFKKQKLFSHNNLLNLN